MFNYNKETGQSRLTAYQLPKLELDETGHTYYDVPVHPYFYNQPFYWQEACYKGNQLPLTQLIERVDISSDANPYIAIDVDNTDPLNPSSSTRDVQDDVPSEAPPPMLDF